jgi:hypothetical protein
MSRKTTKSLWLIAILLLVSLFSFAGMVALAQDEIPVADATAIVPDEAPIEFLPDDGTPGTGIANEFANALVTVLYYSSGTVGLTIVLTSFTKRVLPLPANAIALGYMGALWVIYIVVNNLGFAVQFEQTLRQVTDIGNTLLVMTGTPVATTWLYNKAKAARVPIIGFSKS